LAVQSGGRDGGLAKDQVSHSGFVRFEWFCGGVVNGGAGGGSDPLCGGCRLGSAHSFFCRSAQRAKMVNNMVSGPHIRQGAKTDFNFAKGRFLEAIGTRIA
jgi:hypothetical protein